jgi:hypothetical protein
MYLLLALRDRAAVVREMEMAQQVRQVHLIPVVVAVGLITLRQGFQVVQA